jgi:hypothetical protein
MSEEKTEQMYPVRTLHEFLTELNREWRRFKMGTLVSLSILSTLLFVFVLLFFRALKLGVDIIVYVFPIILAVFVIYSVCTMTAQYRSSENGDTAWTSLSFLKEKL